MNLSDHATPCEFPAACARCSAPQRPGFVATMPVPFEGQSSFEGVAARLVAQILREVEGVFADPAVIAAAWWIDHGDDVEAFHVRYRVQPLPFVPDDSYRVAFAAERAGVTVNWVVRKT